MQFFTVQHKVISLSNICGGKYNNKYKRTQLKNQKYNTVQVPTFQVHTFNNYKLLHKLTLYRKKFLTVINSLQSNLKNPVNVQE